jgi:hypothetical protein
VRISGRAFFTRRHRHRRIRRPRHRPGCRPRFDRAWLQALVQGNPGLTAIGHTLESSPMTLTDLGTFATGPCWPLRTGRPAVRAGRERARGRRRADILAFEPAP